MQRLVVVDCETTGLGRHDRIVEVAAVTLDPISLEIVDEYDTLINPERDVGPVNIHGVTASMVDAAPNFAEVAGALGVLLHGSVLVAHNLSFDSRMLASEFERLGAGFSSGQGICTLALTGEKLIRACERYGVTLEQQHRALADARATASLLARCVGEAGFSSPASVDLRTLTHNPRTHRRDASDASGRSDLARVISLARYPTSDDKTIRYLDMLDWVLDDLVIDEAERLAMTELAHALGLTVTEVETAHQAYLNAILSAARRDGIVTDREVEIIHRVSSALDLAVPEVSATRVPDAPARFRDGLRVCFTGTAVVNGASYGRAELEEIAANADLQPVGSVTKKGCDLLVAADTSSMSGKAKKARDFEIPVVSVEDFLNDLC